RRRHGARRNEPRSRRWRCRRAAGSALSSGSEVAAACYILRTRGQHTGWLIDDAVGSRAEEAAHGYQPQGQPRCELPAHVSHTVPYAATTAEDRPDAYADPYPV